LNDRWKWPDGPEDSALNILIAIGLTFLAIFLLVMILGFAVDGSTRRRDRDIRRRLGGLTMAVKRGTESDQATLLRQELEGTLPLIDRWLQRLEIFPDLSRLLLQARVEWTPADLILRCLAAGFVAGFLAYWRTNYLIFSVAFGAILAAAPMLYVTARRARRFAEIERQLPQALDLLVRALRAGHGLLAGIEMIAKEIRDPLGSEFAAVFDEQNYGLDLREALQNLSERAPIQDIQIIVTAILIQRETGGNLAEVLDNTAKVIRERYRLKRQIMVHTAQGRLTGWVLAGLPVLLGLAIFLARPDFIATLWTNEKGLKLLYGACMLTLVGALVIRHIIRIRV
jgi:tight adherence protein B